MDEVTQKQALYQLIVSQLYADGFAAAASAVASSTAALPAATPRQGDKLVRLVRRAWHVEQQNEGDGPLKGLDLDEKPGKDIRLVEAPIPVICKAPVKAARFSPDGQYIVTGSADAVVRLIHTPRMLLRPQVPAQPTQRTGPEDDGNPVVRSFEEHTQAINDVVFHPTAPLVFSGSRDTSIRAFEYTHYTRPAPRAVHSFLDTFAVRSLDIHPSGNVIASATDHNTVRLWDINTGKCYSSVNMTEQHTNTLNVVRFSLDGRLFATGAFDGSIKVWDGSSGRCVNTTLMAHNGCEVTSLAFSKNNKYLLSSGKDTQTRLWDVSTMRVVVRTYSPPQPMIQKTQRRVTSAFLTPTETHVAYTDETGVSVTVVDARTGEMLYKIPHPNFIRCISTSPSETALLTCCEDLRLRLWTRPAL